MEMYNIIQIAQLCSWNNIHSALNVMLLAWLRPLLILLFSPYLNFVSEITISNPNFRNSLFDVLFVARAFSYFLFARACIIVLYIQLTLDAYFILMVIILFSLPILTFVQ